MWSVTFVPESSRGGNVYLERGKHLQNAGPQLMGVATSCFMIGRFSPYSPYFHLVVRQSLITLSVLI